MGKIRKIFHEVEELMGEIVSLNNIIIASIHCNGLANNCINLGLGIIIVASSGLHTIDVAQLAPISLRTWTLTPKHPHGLTHNSHNLSFFSHFLSTYNSTLGLSYLNGSYGKQIMDSYDPIAPYGSRHHICTHHMITHAN